MTGISPANQTQIDESLERAKELRSSAELSGNIWQFGARMSSIGIYLCGFVSIALIYRSRARVDEIVSESTVSSAPESSTTTPSTAEKRLSEVRKRLSASNWWLTRLGILTVLLTVVAERMNALAHDRFEARSSINNLIAETQEKLNAPNADIGAILEDLDFEAGQQ
ncbi:hypothetical protein [Rubripirellula tenax]|nr:hypothetical protein [Rubripirellula tenax]